MNISALKNSRFLAKADVNSGGRNGILVTIKGDVIEENVAMDGQPEEKKFVLAFHECEKGLVLNSVNAQLIAKIVGSDDTIHWNGHRIVLYEDPTVMMAGRVTGGIRVRAPRNQAPAAPANVPYQPPQPPQPAYQPPAPTPAQYQQPAQPDDQEMPF